MKIRLPQKTFDSVPNSPFIYSSHLSKKYTGKDVRISIISTGLPSHSDIRGIEECEVFASKAKNPDDKLGLSTMLSGIISSNSKQMVGLVPDAKLYFAKAYGANGECTSSNMISSILWSIIKGVDIIAICGDIESDTLVLRDAIKKTYDSNICVFALSKRNNSNSVNEKSYPEIIGIDCSVRSKNFKLLSSINEDTIKISCIGDYYTCAPNNKYVNPPSPILALGISVGRAAQAIDKKNQSKEMFSPRDIYRELGSA